MSIVRFRCGAVTASVVALDEAAIVRARELIEKTGDDPAAEEIRRRAGVFLRRGDAGPVKVALLFSGQGSQYPGMMRALAVEEPEARAVVDRAELWARARGVPSISAWMFSGDPIPTELFAVQSTTLCADVIAHRALLAAGVTPSFVTGHSFGDYAALVAAEVWSLETALDATRIRCETIAETTAASAGMVSIAAELDQARALAAASGVEIANINAPDQIVVAGAIPALETFEAAASAQKLETTRLPIPRAFHSSLMAAAKPLLADRFRALHLEAPRIPYLSSITGRFEVDPEQIRAGLAAQLTLPIDFVSQIHTLLREGASVLIECGPRGVLASLARRIAPTLWTPRTAAGLKGDEPGRSSRPATMIVTTDDAQKPGRWAIARVLAALDSLSPDLSIKVRAASEPGFEKFWADARPHVARFVQSLFEAEAPAPRVRETKPEVMKRHVIRAVVADTPPAKECFAPRSLAIVGAPSPRLEAIARAFTERGTQVVFGAREDTEALGFVLDPAPAPPIWTLDETNYGALREETIAAPFRAARIFRGRALFAVTALGGAFAFENAPQARPEGGGLIGLLKAIRREFPHLQVQGLDASPSEDPQIVARALLAELDAGSPRLEVGLLRGKRMVLAISERGLPNIALETLPRWLITGGARGVTARIALALAELNRPVLHLIGKHPLPPPEELAKLRALDSAELEALKRGLPRPSPLAWKAACEAIDKSLEIDRNLRAIAAFGSEVHYHSVDVADRALLALVVERARPIAGLIHGSGVEIAKAFDRKTDAIFEQTTAAKLDGLINLLHLTEPDAPRAIVGFSSVSGRFGGHGQTDYSLANEAMARVLSSYRAQYLERTAFAVSWPAFSEVGLAARGSAKVFLEQAGQSFMTPDEGAQHLLRELAHGGPETEITVSDHPEHLDQDDACSDRARSTLGEVIWAQSDELIVERRLSAREPFLDQHRMANVPILPAVVALEMLIEAAGVERSVDDFRIRSPIKVPEGGERMIRIARAGELLSIAMSAERADGVVLDPWRVHVAASSVPRVSPPSFAGPLELGELRGAELEYPYGAHLIFHGPMFRVVKSVTPFERGGRAVLIAPEQRSLLPIELLDGCLQVAGMLGRLLHNVVALPAAIGRFHRPSRAAEPGQEITVEVVFEQVSESRLVSNFVARDGYGVLFAAEGYSAER